MSNASYSISDKHDLGKYLLSMVNFALLELNIILSPIRLTNKFQFSE